MVELDSDISHKDRLVLATEREGVILRQLIMEDAPFYFDSWQYSAKDIAKFDPETKGKNTELEEVETIITDGKRVRMGIWDGNKFVGSTSLRPSGEDGVWLLGYWTDSRETGHGYASLAAKALSSYAKDLFPIIRAQAMEENIPSVRILEKSGFARTGEKVGKFTVFELRK